MTSTFGGVAAVDQPCPEDPPPAGAPPAPRAPASAGRAPSAPDPRPADLLITPMRRRHLRSIVRIQAADPHLGWSVGLWIAELRREVDRVYVVAQIGRETVGYGGLLLQGDDAHITTIGVTGSWQQRGIATQILLHLVDAARAEGAKHLTLEVRASNDAAIALYRRFGLAPAGIRKNYYADLGEDALIMWAHDIDDDAYAARLDAVRRRAAGDPAHPREGTSDE